MIRAKGANKLTSWIHIFYFRMNDWLIDSDITNHYCTSPTHCKSFFLFKLYDTLSVPGMLHSKKTNLEAAPSSYIPRKISEQETGYKCKKRVAWQSYPRCAFLIWITLVFVIFCDMAMHGETSATAHTVDIEYWKMSKWANEQMSLWAIPPSHRTDSISYYGTTTTHHMPHRQKLYYEQCRKRQMSTIRILYRRCSKWLRQLGSPIQFDGTMPCSLFLHFQSRKAGKFSLSFHR